MRSVLCVAAVIMLVSSGSASVCRAQPTATLPNGLTAEEKLAGWELLFDGQTSTGWRSPSSVRFPEEHWTIEGGFLRTLARGNRASDIVTTRLYRNFELSFEWKIAPGGNSGVKYLVGSSQKLVFDQQRSKSS